MLSDSNPISTNRTLTGTAPLCHANSDSGKKMNKLVVISEVYSEQEMSNYCAAFFLI